MNILIFANKIADRLEITDRLTKKRIEDAIQWAHEDDQPYKTAPSNVQGVEETAQNYAKGQCWQCRKDGSMDEPCLCSTLERAFIAGSQSQVDISGLVKEIQHHIDTWPDEPKRAIRLVQKALSNSQSSPSVKGEEKA